MLPDMWAGLGKPSRGAKAPRDWLVPDNSEALAAPRAEGTGEEIFKILGWIPTGRPGRSYQYGALTIVRNRVQK